MLNLQQHGNDPAVYNVTRKALAHWGARRPLETVEMAADQLVEHPRLHIPFFYTDNVATSPVSESVPSVAISAPSRTNAASFATP